MDHKNGRKAGVGLLIVFLGIAVMAAPMVNGYLGTLRQQVRIQDQMKELEALETELSDERDEDVEENRDISGECASKELKAFWEACVCYNEKLMETGQEELTSTEAVEYFPLDARDYGFRENMIGSIGIPAMKVEIPLYLGASQENMAKGVGVFGQTMVPMRGETCQTSIAGHRGYRGIPMFRNIQLLQMGDSIYIQTLWETLEYRVCDIRIITPEETDWCLIQKGKNLVTLMTCHPYRQNYQRYVVTAELVEENT